ncbi:MAG: hypothetical protein NW200_00675 [Hyphomonadaceae bacterium]|nr:hypothetical protein [Hyphomonadaceae bacterium]
MIRVHSALLSVLALGAFTLAPAVAEARDHGRHGYYDRGHYGRGYHDRGRHHDDDNDALAAGVVGLALGAVLGAAIASPPAPRHYAPPPPAYYPPAPAYYPPPAYHGGYRASAPVCVVRERVWDPYAGQYVRVERRVRC